MRKIQVRDFYERNAEKLYQCLCNMIEDGDATDRKQAIELIRNINEQISRSADDHSETQA